MATGQVKWFNNAKGYGFILSDEGGEDLFAHYSSIEILGDNKMASIDSRHFGAINKNLIEGIVKVLIQK